MTLVGWIPVSVSESAVEWRYLPGRRFTEPFFEDTLGRAPRGEPRRTTLEAAAEWVAGHQGLEPSGFVFHMSRCGSTLVSRMLAAVEENRVMSEPLPVDDAIKLGDPAALRTVVGALGQPAAGETRFFLKFDCWHIHDYELIRRVFPRTPAIFLYRQPIEVLVSQLCEPGLWTLPLTAVVAREQHVAALLEAILRSALKHADTVRLVNYTELPSAVHGLFGMVWTPAQVECMRRAALWDAKNPYFEFAADSEAKRAAATARAREAVVPLTELYKRLEAIRGERSGRSPNRP